MSNRDDDRFNSPEGNGMSEEGQRKAALAQGTVDGGGAAEEKSGGGETPEPFNMISAVEKEKQKQVLDLKFESYAKKLQAAMEQNAPLQAFTYIDEGLKPVTRVKQFSKDFKSNVLDFMRYAKRTLDAVQAADKQIVNVSAYLNAKSGAASALRAAITLFEKEWYIDSRKEEGERKLNGEHFEHYVKLKFMVDEGRDGPPADVDALEGNFLLQHAKDMYHYRDQFVAKFLEDAAEGSDALALQLKVLRDDPEQTTSTNRDWETILVNSPGLAASMINAYYEADKITVSPEREMALRLKVETFNLDFNGNIPSQVQAFDKACKDHSEVLSRLQGAGSKVCGRQLTTEDYLYYFQRGIFNNANPSRSTAGFQNLATEVAQYGVTLRQINGYSHDHKFRTLKGQILALQEIKNSKKLANRLRERANNVNGGGGRGLGRGGGRGLGGGPGRGGGAGGRGGQVSTKPLCRQWLDNNGKCERENCGFEHPDDLSKIKICQAKSAKHCRHGVKCNMRHLADEKANAVASSTAGSSRASADQESGSDYASGESDDDDDDDE